MTYFDYVRNLENFVKEYKKLMEETQKLKQYHHLESELDAFYAHLGDSLYSVEFDLKFARNNPDYSPKEYKQKEFQDTCDKFSARVKGAKNKLEDYKERIKEQEFVEKGTMTGQEFKRKLLELKAEFQKIVSEIDYLVGGVWDSKYSMQFDIRHDCKDNMKAIDTVLSRNDLFEKGKEKFYKINYIEFNNALTRNKSIWKDLKSKSEKERTF